VVDPESERTLYSSFVSAANAVSQLYTQAVQQQRKASAAASRQTIERITQFLLRECAASETISKSVLLQFLQQEYEGIEGCENAPHHFPVHFLPVVSQGCQGSAEESTSTEPSTKSAGRPGQFASPSPARRSGSAAMETMDHGGMETVSNNMTGSQVQSAYGFTTYHTSDHKYTFGAPGPHGF